MAEAKLPMHGKNSKIVLFYGGPKVPGIEGLVTTWSVKEVATRQRTGIAGRPRKRVDKTVDGYDSDLSVELADLALPNFLKSVDADREAGINKELSVGLEFEERDGTVEGVILGPATATWQADMGNTSEHITGKVMIEAEEYGALAL